MVKIDGQITLKMARGIRDFLEYRLGFLGYFGIFGIFYVFFLWIFEILWDFGIFTYSQHFKIYTLQ